METPTLSQELKNKFIDFYYLSDNTPIDIKIAEELKIEKTIVSRLFKETRNDDKVKKIQKARQLWNTKKSNPKLKEKFSPFLENGFKQFYTWFITKERKCFYCQAEEYKLQKLFDKEDGILKTKRKRGETLELERKNSVLNEYSEKNCEFICYFCNNHKSDIISEPDHIKYFANAIKKYIDDKYEELQKKTK
ncbi:MAG: hypothetical protein HY840_15240 [Bacteroidetes bacterium]|nr:hypothetical protein [Bacteroidota bacterium]